MSKRCALTNRIRQALDAYEDDEAGLGPLVASVDGVIEALFDIADEDWVEKLRSAGSRLEIVYAVGLDEGRAMLSHDDRDGIAESIKELRSLLATREAK